MVFQPDPSLIHLIKSMHPSKLIRIDCDGTVTDTENTHDVIALRRMLGCSDLQLVPCTRSPFVGYEILCDGESKVNERALNIKATGLLHTQVCGTFLNGPVMIRKCKYSGSA